MFIEYKNMKMYYSERKVFFKFYIQDPSPKQVSRKYLPDNHWQRKGAEFQDMRK